MKYSDIQNIQILVETIITLHSHAVSKTNISGANKSQCSLVRGLSRIHNRPGYESTVKVRMLYLSLSVKLQACSSGEMSVKFDEVSIACRRAVVLQRRWAGH